MKFHASLFALCLTFLSQTSFAGSCKVYAEEDYGENLDSAKEYSRSISKAGHTSVSTAAEADLVVGESETHIEGKGVLFFKGKGRVRQLSFDLKDQSGKVVASHAWFKCRVSGRDVEEGIECGPLMTYDMYIRSKAKKIKKLLKEQDC